LREPSGGGARLGGSFVHAKTQRRKEEETVPLPFLFAPFLRALRVKQWASLPARKQIVSREDAKVREEREDKGWRIFPNSAPNVGAVSFALASPSKARYR
jgi:hypothetical protein